ncbi:MAG TPA: hypothetical protein VFA54_12895 [Bryobacterales bacterium]|nr:hypothetical protein [Bryobacterales bacterium]
MPVKARPWKAAARLRVQPRAPRERVAGVAGETSRHKRIEIDGVSQDDLNRFLQERVR